MRKARIRVRGEKEPIIVSETEGNAIEKWFFDKTIPVTQQIKIGGEWNGTKGEITSIRFFKEEVAEEKKDSHVEVEREYEEGKRKTLALTPEQRGKQVARFNLIYANRLGDWNKRPSEKVTAELIRIQTKYFTENKYKLFCPIEIFEHLLPNKTGETLVSKMKI